MGRPKAFLEIDGETFVSRLTRIFREECDPVLLVVGAYPNLTSEGATVVVNPYWPSGQLSSLQAGIRALPEALPAFFFAPVDCPAFSAATVKTLWAAFETDRTKFVIPRMGDRRGHPVLANGSLRGEFLALPPDGEARTIVHRYREQTRYIDVDDPGILADIDTPENYREWKARSSS